MVATVSKNRLGVSIITSTMRPHFIRNVFRNYSHQNWRNKELIIIFNKNKISINKYKKMAKKYRNVSVYQFPEYISLGECLNFAVNNAKHDYIAKFDDDDYYSPNYIPEAMHTFKKFNADLVGKESIFIYLSGRKILLHRSVNVKPFKRCYSIAGATIMFRKEVFKRVKFPRISLGEDQRFIIASLKKSYKMYTSSSSNFVAIRRKNINSHSWKVHNKELLSGKDTKIVARTKSFKKYVFRPNGTIISKSSL